MPHLYISAFLLLVSILAFAHTYLVFPLIVVLLGKKRIPNSICFEKDEEELPSIAILFSCYNEEKVISQKLSNSLEVEYPKSKLTFFIGSDCSTDNTDSIINQFVKSHPEVDIRFFPSRERRGKPEVINELAIHAQDFELFILTDADVLLKPDALYQLTKHFKNPEIGLVDGNLLNLNQESEVSATEGFYQNRESTVKYNEGLIWGLAMGPSGGCYAIRAKLYAPVPKGFLVDDFYIAMRIMETGYMSISEPSAKCYEHSPSQLSVEFKRKTRIATGNFKNLETFAHLLSPSRKALAWVFWSHKVLRWLGPAFLLIILLCTTIIAISLNNSALWITCALLYIGVPVLGLLTLVADALRINISLVKPLWYFACMNLAIAYGFLKYIQGTKTSIWQPTERS